MRNISAYHWFISFSGALLVHVALAASLFNPDPPQMERQAGNPVVIVGALSALAEQQAVEETTTEKIDPVEPVKEVDEIKPDNETPMARLEAEPINPVDDAQAPELVPEKRKVEPIKKKKEKKLKKKVKRDKKKKKRVKASKRTAALKKGSSSKGKQKKIAGKAAISNYRGRVQAHLARFKRSTGAKGRVTVSFTVTKSGGVVGVRLVRRSGNGAIDRAAVSMVRRASPFPPIPAGWPGRMRFSVPIKYR